VVMSSWQPSQQRFLHRTVSASSVLLGSCHRTNITTVEGIGTQAKPHAIQTRLAEYHAVQCGFDSPGTVVSMYGLLLNNEAPSMKDIEASQVGNISRCSGYRAVLEAFRVFTEKSNTGTLAQHEANLPDALKSEDSEPVVLRGHGVAWHRVPSHFWVKALEKKEKRCVVVYGLPTPAQVAGKATIIDMSSMEQKLTCTRTNLEVTANTTVSKFAEDLATMKADQQSQMSRELVRVLQSLRTPQWRVSTGLGDALASNRELQVALLALRTKLVATSTAPALGSGPGDKTLELEEVVQRLREVTLRSLIIPLPVEQSHLMFYRVAPRKANPAGATFAAFNITLEGEAITNCRLFMGRAKVDEGEDAPPRLDVAMRLLQGKNITSLGGWLEDIKKISADTMIQNLIFKLLQDLQVVISGSAGEKVRLEEEHWPSREAIQATQSAEVPCPEGASSTSPLGMSVPNVAGVALATGEAVFTEDIPKTSNELFLAPVCSTMAHAKILSVDPSAALALPGVVRLLTIKDVPEGLCPFKILGNCDEVIFPVDTVMYEGQPIAAIIACNQKVARQAAALVKVEYEPLKPVVTIDDAIAANSYIDVDEQTTITSLSVGDVDDALAKSDAVVEGSIETTRQEHFYEETNIALVVPVGEDDEYKIYSCTPNLLMTQQNVAMFLGIPFNRVTCITKRIGCSYGGKIARFVPLTIATALAAKLTRRPVRCHLTRDEDIRIMGQRGEFRGDYKIGVTNGKITGASIKMFKNAGWNSDASPDIVATSMMHIDNSYEFPTFHVEGKTCKTNTPSNAAFRAYGAPPAMTITENMIYDACAQLRMDPLKFRRDNLQRAGWENHYGQVMVESDVTMNACLDEVIARCNYHELRQQVEEFNLNNKWRKRGVYLIPNKYGIGLPGMFAQNGALVHVYLDGSVLISHGGTEMGQGLHTKMIQIVATELGLPINRIKVADSSNDKVPNAIPTGGSTGADLNGNALRDACQQIMERMAPLRAAAEKAPWEMLVQMAFGSRINLSAVGYFAVPDDQGLTFDPVSKKGKRWWYYTVGAACSLVEIDVLTGEHVLLSTEMVVDVGQAINPAIDIANIEAAFIQGYGWIAMENTTFGADGKLLTRGHDEYNIPTIADCPSKFNVTLLKSEKRKHILYSSKGIGEPPFFNGVSVYFAIKEAVRAARSDAGISGKFSLKQPAVPEHVLEACANSPLA